MSPRIYAIIQGRACIGEVLERTVNRYFTTWLLVASLLYMMQAAARGGDRRDIGHVPDHPSYDPAHERTQLFTEWTQQFMIWCTLAKDLNQWQKASAIFSQLRGEAGIMAQNLSQTDIAQEGIVVGDRIDSV